MEFELYKKIKAAIESPIIGDYVFPDDELKEIYRCASEVITNKTYLANNYSASLTFIALVNACHSLESRPESFHVFLGECFDPPISISRKVINDLVDKMPSFTSSFKINYGHYNVSTICAHALAPTKSTEAFFKLCWQLFVHDFDYQYERDDDLLKTIFTVLKNKICGQDVGDDEDVKIGSQSYSFQSGLKGMINCAREVFIDFLDSILVGIDTLFFRRGDLDSSKYSYRLLKDWWDRIQEEYGIEEKRRIIKGHEQIVSDYSKIKPKYICEEGIVSIRVPSIRFTDDFDEIPYYELYSGDKLIQIDELRLHETSGILVNSKQFDIPVEKCGVSDIRIVIHFKDKVICDTENNLWRDFVIFRNEYEVTEKMTSPGMYVLYANSLSSFKSYPSRISKINTNTYSFDAIEGDVLKSENRSVLFVNDLTNKDVHFFVQKNSGATFFKDGKEFELIDGDLYLNIGCDVSVEDTGIKYDNERFSLASFQEESTDLGQVRRFKLSILKGVGETQEIAVFSYKKRKNYCSINFVKFDDINITYDKKFYLLNDNVNCRFKTKKYNKEFSFIAGEKKQEVDFNGGKLVLNTEIVTWQIDQERVFDGLETIFYKEFTNASVLQFNTNLDVVCFVRLGDVFYSISSSKKNVFKIGNFLHSMAYMLKDACVFFSINEGTGGTKNTRFPVLNVVFEEKALSNSVFIDEKNKQILWDPKAFIGDKRRIHAIYVLNKEHEVMMTEKIDLMQCRTINVSELIDGIYFYELRSLEKSFISKEKTIIAGSFVVGSRINVLLSSGVLKVSKAKLIHGDERTLSSTIFIEDIKPFAIEENILVAYKIYTMDGKKNKYYWNKAIKPSGQIVLINSILIEIINDNACRLCYGGDGKTKASYRSKFRLTDDNIVSVNVYESGEETSAIDYFRYEVV